MGRPLSARSLVVYGLMDVQIAAIHGLLVLRGQNKEVENCLLLTWYWARKAAGEAEGLNAVTSKPSKGR